MTPGLVTVYPQSQQKTVQKGFILYLWTYIAQQSVIEFVLYVWVALKLELRSSFFNKLTQFDQIILNELTHIGTLKLSELSLLFLTVIQIQFFLTKTIFPLLTVTSSTAVASYVVG